jgi:hypothetical protein
MEDFATRLSVLLKLLLPLVLFMASIYLALHVLFARLVHNPQSPVLWFFAVVTGPLTRPVRTLLPTGTPEARVRTVSLVVYVGLWLLARAVLAGVLSG